MKQNNNIKIFSIILFITVLVCGCREKEPVKIGFVGELSGRHSDLGISGRNGVMLAVEEINKKGGINGQYIELIIKNDKHDPKLAVQTDRELTDSGVAAIIGHMTSTMSVAAVPLINKEKILMISPTASTMNLTGLDDYFFRVTSSVSTTTKMLARYSFNTMKLKKIAIVYEISNIEFSGGWYNSFTSEFKRMGGEIAVSETFVSGSDARFFKIAQALLDPEPDGILIIAGALDSAMICQHLAKKDPLIPVVSSGWAFTQDFIEHGGPSAEGVIFVHTFDGESRDKRYLAFKKNFNDRFGRDPGFAAIFGYEAAQVLFAALSESSDITELKENIIRQEVFHGLQGDFKIDKYGDPKRKIFLITIKNGQFRTLEQL
ncbi:MAG: amino acid ABC transporter substrate-binding protein [Desulfobacterales bacterium]|nr:amino acid ABC transporter substrate-binding protein [Desulfobacterales bacterium]